jgi:hypothetical protein
MDGLAVYSIDLVRQDQSLENLLCILVVYTCLKYENIFRDDAPVLRHIMLLKRSNFLCRGLISMRVVYGVTQLCDSLVLGKLVFRGSLVEHVVDPAVPTATTLIEVKPFSRKNYSGEIIVGSGL